MTQKRLAEDETGQQRASLVALLRARPGRRTWAEITESVIAAGSAEAVWDELFPPSLIDEFDDDLRSAADNDIVAWQSDGTQFVTVLDSAYPRQLLDIHQVPPVLFARGQLVRDDIGVSVVGSRDASPRGLQIASETGRYLASRGVTVIAGLALGIDTAAHLAALECGGRTVAVIGSGINLSYPAANRALQAQIAERGLLLSQFWPDAPPRKHHFLMRNATMSGYGVATVVVEAGEFSGARSQARMAVEHGRPVILTDLVLDRTSWAKELEGRPGVFIARSTQELQDHLAALTTTGGAFEDGEFERLLATI